MYTAPDSSLSQAETQELLKCSFENWYLEFDKISIPSILIQVPPEIVTYLLDEIIILPKECYPNESKNEVHFFSDGGRSDFDADENNHEAPEPEFPQFSYQIANAIKSLPGSAAFIKTNWRAPKDAYWITAGQTLKVKDITDVYQLLKASNITTVDFSRQFLTVPCLVLKEWQEIHPGTEFRCFVRGRDLIAISPRDWPQYHKHIIIQRWDIVSDIVSVFKEKIKYQFPLENFVFDVVRHSKDHVQLVDFSPFNEKFTESLAFEWDYLRGDQLIKMNSDEQDDPEFRYLTTDCGVQPTKRNNYGIPQDIIELFTGTNAVNANDHLTNLIAARVHELELNDESSLEGNS